MMNYYEELDIVNFLKSFHYFNLFSKQLTVKNKLIQNYCFLYILELSNLQDKNAYRLFLIRSIAISKEIKSINIFIMLLPFQDLEYPRKKNILHNLNNLFGSQLLQVPEKSVALKFKGQIGQSNRSKSALIQSKNKSLKNLSNNVIKNDKNMPLSTVKAFNQLKWAKSSNNQQDQQKNKEKMQRKQKMKALLSIGNLHKTITNNRKVHTSQTYRNRKSNPDPHINVQNMNYVDSWADHFQLMPKSAQIPENQHREHFATANSTRLYENQHKYSSPLKCDPRLRFSSVDSFSHTNKNQEYWKPSNETRQKKQYLKKGTSINKGILNSIIKLKLSKQPSNTAQDIDNEQIIKMIKVYKGNIPNICVEKQRLKSARNINKNFQSLKERQQENPLIMGWENQTEEFIIQ